MCLVRVSARGWGGLEATAGLHRARRGRRAVGDHHSEPTADRVVVADRALHDTQIAVQRKASTSPSFVDPPNAILPAGTQPGPTRTLGRGSPTTTSSSARSPKAAGRALASCERASSFRSSRIAARSRWSWRTPSRRRCPRRSRAWTRIFVETDRIPVRALVQRASSPPEVKETIAALYRAAPDRLRQVLLLGHVPVPYSGNIAPDHHYRPTGNGLTPTHQGAWPADIYYGDMVGAWTDTTVDTCNNDIRRPIRSTSTSPATASSTRRRRRPTTSARVAPAACRRTGGDASHWRSAASISPSCRPSPPERDRPSAGVPRQGSSVSPRAVGR